MHAVHRCVRVSYPRAYICVHLGHGIRRASPVSPVYLDRLLVGLQAYEAGAYILVIIHYKCMHLGGMPSAGSPARPQMYTCACGITPCDNRYNWCLT
jgi:hypothetical protein